MTATEHQDASLSPEEAKGLAQEAWLFGMPLVYMEIQIDTATHVTRAEPGRAPINQFAHYRKFPDAADRTVVGINVDTLYSFASLDLAKEPMVLSVPDMGKRYWLMQILDAWNNVPHAPGSRTLGGRGGHFAIVGPAWRGSLPAGVTELRVPTNLALIGGRTFTGGPDDYAAVHALQERYSLVPLSSWSASGATRSAAREVPLKPGVDTSTPVPHQVLALSPEQFFQRLNRLLVTNPPEPADPATLARIARLHVAPGATFRMSAFTPAARKAIEQGIADAVEVMRETERGHVVNGWQIALDMGRFGTRYAARAGWTFFAVGANLPEDAVYPFAGVDGSGQPLHGAHAYTLRFSKAQIPPVDAFWSLTLYDTDSYLVANPLQRYALGDRSPLKFDADGGLTLHIQSDSPGKDAESNWLPTPADAPFKLALRLYAPKKQVADGTWSPPPVRLSGE